MLLHEVPLPVSRASGKRLVTLCLIAVTLVLLGIPDEADLQPVMVGGLQSFSDGEDDADDGGDVNGQHIPVAAVFGALVGESIVTHRHMGETAGAGDRIDAWESSSPRG